MDIPDNIIIGIYMSIFNISYIIILFFSIIALRNLKLIIFKSLGHHYIFTLLFLSSMAHLLNSISLVAYVIDNNSINETVYSDGIVINYDIMNEYFCGIRMWVIAMIFSALIGRQFMLSKIFHTVEIPYITTSLSSHIQTLWSSMIISSLLWIPIFTLFLLQLYINVPYVAFIICFTLYYMIYISVFFILAYKNRNITKIYSDYYTNLFVGISLILVIFIGIIITIVQFIISSDYNFGLLINFPFGIGFVIPSLTILGKPCYIYFFDKKEMENWQNFNKNNKFIYGENSSETNVQVLLRSSSETPSQLLSTINIREMNI